MKTGHRAAGSLEGAADRRRGAAGAGAGTEGRRARAGTVARPFGFLNGSIYSSERRFLKMERFVNLLFRRRNDL